MLSEKTKIFIIIALIAAIGIFYIATIRQGHGWGGDFSLYIHHAINIAEAVPYEDTGYIYNPADPFLSPKTYPPIFPLMLAPVYKTFGMNFTAFKIEVILCFLLALFFIYLVLKKELSFKYLLTLLIIMALHPFFWSFKDSVLSDIPFLLWSFLTLFLIGQAFNGSHSSAKRKLFYGILIGFFSYLAYGTRMVGIVLLPCLAIYDLIKLRCLSKITIIAGIVFILLAGAQMAILPSDSSYFDQFRTFNIQTVIKSFLLSAKALIFFWGDHWADIVLGVMVALLALFGFISRLKNKKITFLEIFLIFYVLIIGIWPSNQGIRFLIPIIPLFLFYVFYSLQKIEKSSFVSRKKAGKLIFVFLVLAIFFSYGGRYLSIGFGPIAEGPFKKESIELFEFIKQKTEPNGVFIFNKPRVLALFTVRRASTYHESKTDQGLWNYFAQISADYLVRRQRVYVSNFLDDFVSRNQSELENVFSNSDFAVYRIRK